MKHLERTISNKAYWTINKHLSRILGLQTTLVLQHFIDLQTKVFGNKEFYQSYQQIEKELGLTYHYIRESVSLLRDKKLLVIEKRGMPAKNHYFVLLNNVNIVLSQELDISQVKLAEVQTSDMDLTSEAKYEEQDQQISPNKTSDNRLTKKSYNNKSINKKEIIKKNTKAIATSNSGSEKNILTRLLDDVIQYDNSMKFKRSFNEIQEYGGLDKVFDYLNFDESQKSNWTKRINSVKINLGV